MARIPFRSGPLLLCALAALYRAIWLSVQLSGLDASELGYLLLADLPIIGMLAVLPWVEATLPRALKAVPLVLMVVVLVFYLADCSTVLALNSRLQLADVRQFAVEWWLLPAYVNIWSLAGVLIVVGSFFVKPAIPHRVFVFTPGTAAVLLLLPFAVPQESIPSHLHKYTGSVLLLGKELWGSRQPPISRYRPADFSTYRVEYDALFDAPIAESGTNIVLVIVESLSAVDSNRTSGIRNVLPRFDELTRKGMLFRNFLANFEASEGGIVSLLSGVPPLHFPTASTNTFGEYALQRSVTESFKRKGYRTEFITTVPLQFISMDDYTRSPLVGFSFAGGQKELQRFTAAPKFAFESPGDRVLYEEVLNRLEPTAEGGDRPVFMVAVTASSHPPYVDPRGRGNSEQHAWEYVQDELWWLYEQLDARGFFDNGLLIITSDHRKMVPVHEKERDRFGESAKARVPLAIIGKGVPKDAIDDRLFQQADLLRMLDRAIQPGAPLSPFVLWVERYVFVFGVASNASNVQVFESDDRGRQGYRLNLRGAEIEWVDRPADALSIERSIHRQRALQQAGRMARMGERVLKFGRDLRPAEQAPGMLLGLSSDTDAARDPDDPQGALRMMTTESFDLDAVRAVVGDITTPFTMTVRAFLPVSQEGEYWFSVYSDDETCLAVDKQVVLNCHRGLSEGVCWLQPGVHRFDFRYVQRRGKALPRLRWLPPGARQFTDFPQQVLLRPATD